ncbi:unnamed protein product [Sphagnum jensenii]|uniref:DAGKc domain-containing protein n=1 Tax=Sphagnum jensenii TaxID=128206 RepID=A0ABP0X4N3_9BRYO
MEAIVEEELQLDGAQVRATLRNTGVLQWHGSTKQGSLVVQDDLIGIKGGGELCIILHTFCLSSSSSSKRPICRAAAAAIPKRKRKDMRLSFANERSRQMWFETIQRFLDEAGRPKKLMVIVNPFGGEGAGKKLFLQIVEPLLLAAKISFTMKETMFNSHAKDLAKSLDLSQFDGIVCVSGDGVLVEVLNGLLERVDWKHAIRKPLGIIPAGTGNGMAKSLLHHAGEFFDVASATFLIIRGHKQALDVATVAQGQVRFHSILMLSWGLVADVDFESEKYRWMGRFRFDFQTLIRIVNLRRYNGSFSYLPAEHLGGTGGPYSSELEVNKLLQNNEADSARSWRKGYSGPLQSHPSSDWRSMDGVFVLVWLNNVPFAGETAMPAPLAKFSDGCLDLLVLRDCSRWELFGLLFKLQDGSHIKSKSIEYLKVKAFRLSPGGRCGSEKQGGYVDLDGEVLARGQGSHGDASNDPMVYGPTIEVSIQQGLATLFCPS